MQLDLIGLALSNANLHNPHSGHVGKHTPPVNNWGRDIVNPPEIGQKKDKVVKK